MAAKEAIKDIYSVGVQDPELRVFDIIMYSAYGTSYNSYIVKGAEKTALFETSKLKFWDEYVANIREVVDPQKIDYIIMSHTEPDHSGVLARLLKLAPNATVVGSRMAIMLLKEIVNGDFPNMIVSDGDSLDLGGKTLSFMMTPMLHWPDTMFTYIPESRALFTCDSFGCHYADDRVFNDLIDGDFTEAYKYYFDNIIGPYKNPFMLNALKRIEGLDIEFIGNGHGPVIRSNAQKYIDMYKNWSTPQPRDKKRVAIAYVSSYGFTRELAEHIAKGATAAGAEVASFDLVTCDRAAATAAIAAADGFLLGSPTMVGDALPPVWEQLIALNPIIHKGKRAAAFGSFAWSGEAVPNLTARMEALKLDVVPGLRVKLKPTAADLAKAEAFGIEFVEGIK